MSVAILAGGGEVRDEAHARELGADGWTGSDAATADVVVRTLTGSRPGD